MCNLALENLISDTKNSLNEIKSEAEKFVNGEVWCCGVFNFGGWDDACGRKIGEELISSVSRAVDDNLELYDCLNKLDTVYEALKPAASAIAAAKKVTQ